MKSCIVLAFVLFAAVGYGQSRPPDEFISRTPLVNPFRNVKSSIILQGGYAQVFGYGVSAGFELRRFISLKEYIYANAAYEIWDKKQVFIKTKNSRPGSYHLTVQSWSGEVGLGFLEKHNVSIGVRHHLDVYLSESVPSVQDPDINTVLEGNITAYTRPFNPYFGYNARTKLWQSLFLDIGYEMWVYQRKLFTPLQTNWKVPDNDSPFMSKTYDLYSYFYLACHFKL